MAVLEAVRGWEELADLPHINDVRKDGESAESKDDAQTSEPQGKDDSDDEQEKQDADVWTAEKLEKDLDGLVRTDYISLLLEYEEHVRSPFDGESSICKPRVSFTRMALIV